jgi:hypothetical protein
MSYTEYNDLFKKAQNNGNYMMFVLDISGSKNMDTRSRINANISSLKLLKYIYQQLSILETDHNVVILHHNPIFNDENSHRLDLNEPFHLHGYSYGFTLIRDSIPNEMIYKIIEDGKQELAINFNYHISIAYYETDEYVLGNTKYFRGYCMQYLCLEKNKRIKDI